MMYFNGCSNDGPGHYLWSERSGLSLAFQDVGPFKIGELDARLCPGYVPSGTSHRERVRIQRPQFEGEAKLTHRDGWTALAFWDRSVDKRPGSNACFVIEGVYNFEDMIALIWTRFPGIVQRFNFKIQLAPELEVTK